MRRLFFIWGERQSFVTSLAPWRQPQPHGCWNGAEGGDPRAPRPHGCGNGAEGRDPRAPRASAKIDVVQTGAWILPDERPLPAELLAFLDAGAPPVYVGFGSLPAPKDFARMVIDVVREQGRRVLISRGWAELALVDDCEDCFIVGEVNQQALFPRVAAVIHHGGAGTTTAAAQAGSPQVVVPQIVDQPYWASRVFDLEIGSAHDGPMPTAESLSAAP